MNSRQTTVPSPVTKQSRKSLAKFRTAVKRYCRSVLSTFASSSADEATSAHNVSREDQGNRATPSSSSQRTSLFPDDCDAVVVAALNGGVASGGNPYWLRELLIELLRVESPGDLCSASGGPVKRSREPVSAANVDCTVRVFFDESVTYAVAVITSEQQHATVAATLLNGLFRWIRGAPESHVLPDGSASGAIGNDSATLLFDEDGSMPSFGAVLSNVSDSRTETGGVSGASTSFPVLRSASCSSTSGTPRLMLWVPSPQHLCHMLNLDSFDACVSAILHPLLQRTPILDVGRAVPQYLRSLSPHGGTEISPAAAAVAPVSPAEVRNCRDGERSVTVYPVDQIPGVYVVPDFISEDEHRHILQDILTAGEPRGGGGVSTQPITWEVLNRRSVAHFYRKFYYGSNTLGESGGSDLGANIDVQPIFDTIRRRLTQPDGGCGGDENPWPVPSSFLCDQLTVNHYSYGAASVSSGIAHHVDAHTPFDDFIFSVSLGSHTVMEFKRFDDTAPRVGVFLAPRTLLIMSGEGRFAWTHAISESRVDYISDEAPALSRTDRFSLTFRKGRDRLEPHSRMSCICPALCDAPEQPCQ